MVIAVSWLAVCALAAWCAVGGAQDRGTRALSDSELAGLFGTEMCGCALEQHTDCTDADEQCPCAQTQKPQLPGETWIDPTCSGAKRDFWNGNRYTCMSGNKLKRCIPHTIKCWIEKSCTADGEVRVNTYCPQNGTACASATDWKCVQCKLGNPTGFELPRNDEECVAN